MKQWQDFEARKSDQRIDGNFVSAADELGLILVTGEDAGEFLQNQLSNDINFIDESRFQISSYSTPKGRMVGIFRVIHISNGFILVTAKSMVMPLLERLFKFIVQARVNLADASDYFARIGFQTDNPDALNEVQLPDTPGTVLQNDSVIALQFEALGPSQRYLLMFLSADDAIETWKRLAMTLPVADFASWRLAEIRAGIPAVYPPTEEEFVLQMANLGALDGVSFKKGCYPGQEIVARMQYLGKLKRRMFLARLDTGRLPLPGDEIIARGKTEADGSGKVVDAEFDAAGTCHCLYIAQIAKAESNALCLLDQPDVSIENQALPYSFEN